MRKLLPLILFIAVLGLVGFYAWRVKHDVPPVAPAPVLPVHTKTDEGANKSMAVVNGRPAGMLPFIPAKPFDPHGHYKPGEYTPRGFSANFREQIIKDFGDSIDYKLGKDFPVEKRKKMAEVQNEFWDDHGPDVDLFKDGKMSQPEFAEKTHLSTQKFMNGMAQVLSDAEYLKLFDLPKDVDAFYQLYHSPEEQPGMPLNNGQQQHANNSVLPRPASGAPSPAHVDSTGATVPATPGTAPPPAAPGWTAPDPGQPKK